MKYSFVIFVATVLLATELVAAASGGQRKTNRVRRQGVKGGQPQQQQDNYVEQEPTYGTSAVAANTRARPLPSSPARGQGAARQQAYKPSAPAAAADEDDGSYRESDNEESADAEPPTYGGVAGTPGVDFPAYTAIPATSFSCSGVPYEPGMYADEETQCQAYHVCFDGRKESFLCGVGTVFNQAILACDYWHAVECGRTKEFLSKNEELGKLVVGIEQINKLIFLVFAS